MRLDHLLSKESHLVCTHPLRCAARDTPSWCTIGSVARRTAIVGLPLAGCRPADLVFSSVLREQSLRHGMSRLHRGDSAAATCGRHCPSPLVTSDIGLGPPRRMVRPLRTAEQARAFLEVFQAKKSQRWMPWRQEPMKDVSDCEKPRGVVY